MSDAGSFSGDKRFLTLAFDPQDPAEAEKTINSEIEKHSGEEGFKKEFLEMVCSYSLFPFLESPIVIAEAPSTLRARTGRLPAVKTLCEIEMLGKVFDTIYTVFQQDETDDSFCPPAPFYRAGEIVLEIFESGEPHDLEGSPCEKERLKELPCNEKKITLIRSSASLQYRANCDGYLAMNNGVLTICEPVRISDDNSEAAALFLPQPGDEAPLINSVYEWYNRFTIAHPAAPVRDLPDRQSISLPGKLAYKVILAMGEKPVMGGNAYLEMVVRKEELPGEEKDNIDYREIKNYITVEKGELLFKKYPRVRGKRGVDIYGNPIEVPEGSDFKLIINENIEREDTEEGMILFKASTDGIFNFENNRASVEEVMVVDSKIDYRTGNIYYSKPVQIRGDVSGGFTVSSEKDIIVEGSVEDGASVICKGNLYVLGGIIGSRTRVEVSGNITAGHVMDAELFCSGHTLIRKTVIGGIIFSKKSLIVQGLSVKSADKSAMFGGSYYSMQKIKTHSAGNENRQTLLCCGYNPFAEKSIEELKEASGALDLAISHTMAKLGGKINRPDFKKIIAGMGAQEKKETKEKLLRLKELSAKKNALEIRKKYLLKNIYSKPEEKPSIVVDKYIVPDVQLQIMDGKTVIERRTRSLFIDNV